MKGGQPVAQADPTAPEADKKSAKPKAAAAPAAPSARKLLVNMEEWRWMPELLGDFYVWVNVPEFTLRVVKNGKVIHTERVVVGKRDTPTPIFSQDMEQVIFHPNWGVPESIKKAGRPAEPDARQHAHLHLLPPAASSAADATSIRRPWIGRPPTSAKFHVYQPPGENNVLGNIKFRFPNKHDVYMHDTPQKHLFNADVRAFSHGCMRVRNPQRLAELLLAEDQGWPAQRVAAAFAPAARRTTRSTSAARSRCTSPISPPRWSDDGKLKQFADIYDHESKIALGLEGKAHLIPAEGEGARSAPRPSAASPRRTGPPATPSRTGPSASLEIIDHLGRILAAGCGRSRSAPLAPMLPHSRHSMD